MLFISCTLALSLTTGWLLVAVVRSALLKRGLLDLPNARSSHVRATPRGGGVAILILTLVGVLIAWGAGGMSGALALTWTIGGGLVGLVGLLDDVHGLSPAVRAGAHLLAAALLLHAVDFGAIPSLAGLSPAALIVAGLLIGIAVVWSINLFNFMDGIDGLAAAQCVFVGAAGAMLTGTAGAITTSLPLLVMAGAAAGFMLWNTPPARIFMGDVGSGFVGFALAAGALTLSHHGLVDPWTWLVLDSLFVADATVTLTTRVLRGQRIYEAHRLHVYQRLARCWRSHGRVTALYSGINLLWCLPWAIATSRSSGHAPALALAEFAILCLAMIALGGGLAEETGSMQPGDIESG